MFGTKPDITKDLLKLWKAITQSLPVCCTMARTTYYGHTALHYSELSSCLEHTSFYLSSIMLPFSLIFSQAPSNFTITVLLSSFWAMRRKRLSSGHFFQSVHLALTTIMVAQKQISAEFCKNHLAAPYQKLFRHRKVRYET